VDQAWTGSEALRSLAELFLKACALGAPCGDLATALAEVERFNRGYAKIQAVGLARATNQRLAALLRRLEPVIGGQPANEREHVTKTMASETQYAINLLSVAARSLSRQVEPMGHDQEVAFLQNMVESTEAEHLVVALSETLLLQLTDRVAELVAGGSLNEGNLLDLVEGNEGRTLAFQTLFGMVSQMPLWTQPSVADSPGRSTGPCECGRHRAASVRSATLVMPRILRKAPAPAQLGRARFSQPGRGAALAGPPVAAARV